MNLTSMFGRVNQRTIQQPYSIDPPVNYSIMRLNFQSPPPLKPETKSQNASHTYSYNSSKTLINESGVKGSTTMTWGMPTWYFLHTLAEKIRVEDFPKIREEILDIVYSICTNLPCPDCANHAKTYLDNINFNTIQKKEDLKNMLFVFHNMVNQRKGYPIFSVEQLNTLYPTAITINIFENFFKHYLKKNAVPKMIANEMFRRRIIYKIRDWLLTNMNYFMP